MVRDMCGRRQVLPDGLVLSFLTYFTGTVDWFSTDEARGGAGAQDGSALGTAGRERAAVAVAAGRACS